MPFVLSKKNISKILSDKVSKPSAALFDLPEKVIQFGTGVLLRGLPDFFIHKANERGIFNGRALVVKSTNRGDTDGFAEQDGLYTLCIKGIENGKTIEQNIINASISRVLSANQDWEEILKSAHNPEMQIIISNTTEVGIVESDDKVQDSPPKTYPGKLLTFLYERFKAFNGSASSGMIVLPTELISNNADLLKEILIKLSRQNELGNDFTEWLTNHNYFCNTLVDRIVPGSLPDIDQQKLEHELGYKDELAIMAEPFRLWAIESSNKHVIETLSFASADKGISIVPSIDKFKELKLRLLNGTHTLSCALAILAGFATVKDAMEDKAFRKFVLTLMQTEIAPLIEGKEISHKEAQEFANSVIDRFSNPFLDHKWQAITLNYTSKLKMRSLPLLGKYYAKENKAPEHTALGMAAFILFMNVKKQDNYYTAVATGHDFKLQDESASTFFEYWQQPETVVKNVLADINLWDEDLNKYPSFYQTVEKYASLLQKKGAKEVLNGLTKS